MKRPLFWVCVALSLIAVLHFFGGGAADREGIRASEWARPSDDPPWGEERILFSGRVCGKELQENSSYFLLTELSVIQDAATSRQIISILGQMNTDQIQCFPEGEAAFSFPKIGSEVIVSGVFSFYAEATNPGEWNPAEYYQGRRIGGRLSETSILFQSEKNDPLREGLFVLREYFAKRLEKVFPAREAGILKAMLLGERAALDPEIRELYRDGGILHVLSISGLHVSLLGLGFYELLRRMGLSVKPAAILAGMVLAIYGIMTGMSVSACRAIGMFLLRMLGNFCGRTYDMLTALAVMACLMLCMTPASAVNSGFWLSFGAMLGVIGILPLWERFVKNRKERLAAERLEAGRFSAGHGRIGKCLSALEMTVLKGLRTSASVLLATLPILLSFYYEIPVYSTLINLIVIPAMGPALVFGFLAMAVPGLGFLGTVDVAAFRLFEALCRVTRGIPGAIWNPGCPVIWQVVAYYGVLAAVLALIWRSAEGPKRDALHAPPLEGNGSGRAERFRQRWKEILGRWGTLGMLLPILLFLIPAHRMTGVVFLDVGQGDCVLLRLSDGQTWLYDCGSTGKKNIGEKILIPYLRHEGIRRIDGVFLSHGDKDHTSGAEELLSLAKEERIRIGGLYLPVTGKESGEFSEVLESWGLTGGTQVTGGAKEGKEGSEGKEGLVRYLRAGDELAGEGISMSVLHPKPGMNGGNEASLCLLVTISEKDGKRGGLMGSEGDAFDKGRDLTILLTGDVEKEGEEELLEECKKKGIREVTILKCAHHGSRNGTSDAFLSQLDAKVTVISCGRKNSYGHPHEETQERLLQDGTKLFRTDQLGAVTIRLRRSDLLEIRTGR